MSKKISILGSTGSIGRAAISLLSNELKKEFKVNSLSFHTNAKLALEQAKLVNAKTVIATSREGYLQIQNILPADIELKFGQEALKEECQNPEIDIILIAIVGISGLKPTLDSIINSKRLIALANKESIICGWHLIKKKLEGSKTKIIPVDSEHNSLFRLLKSTSSSYVEDVFITSSGGNFAGREFSSLKHLTPKEVTSHPVWNMGSKISVDSSTMANKGLELIEVCNLFKIEESKVGVFIAKGSVLHAGVNLKDGSSLWFLSMPDMKNHISHAILDEEIKNIGLNKVLPLQNLSSVSFTEVKKEEFPIFFIAKEVANSKSIQKAISFNILNEIAVENFLLTKIPYTDILKIIEENINFNPLNFKFETIEEVLEFNQLLRTKLNF